MTLDKFYITAMRDVLIKTKMLEDDEYGGSYPVMVVIPVVVTGVREVAALITRFMRPLNNGTSPWIAK